MTGSTVELTNFLWVLKKSRNRLSVQQYRTLKGQALAGNIAASEKGLQKIMKGR